MNALKSIRKTATNRALAVSVVLALGLAGASLAGPVQSAEFSVYKSPWCGCCEGWVEEMQSAGHTMIINDMDDISAIKKMAGVPDALQACHTAMVDGYVIEGHVPVVEVERFLAEGSEARGIAVAGMPMGAPGMGGTPEPFDVMLFEADGTTSVYASY
jgi:hypothetical protein